MNHCRTQKNNHPQQNQPSCMFFWLYQSHKHIHRAAHHPLNVSWGKDESDEKKMLFSLTSRHLRETKIVLCWPHPENVMWKFFPRFSSFSIFTCWRKTFFLDFSSFLFHHDKKVCRKWSLIGFVHTALWIGGGSENLLIENLIKIYFLPLCFQFNWL